MSEADVGSMAVEVEPYHQYSVLFCCCVTDGSREAIWQNGIWHGGVCEPKVCHSIPPCGKNCTHWHPSMRAEHLWISNSGCEHSEVMGGAFQQWWQWITSAGADFYKRGTQPLVYRWQKCIANGDDCVEKQCFVAENLLYQCYLALCISFSFHRSKQEALFS